jgi:hypothetical protein
MPSANSSGGQHMAEDPLQETFSTATKSLFGTIGFLLLLFGGEMMIEKQEPRLVPGAILIILGVLCFYLVVAGHTFRSRLPVTRLNAIGSDPRWWLATVLTFVFAIGAWRLIELRFSDAETQKFALVGWLDQAHRERDAARQAMADTEAQKITLVEWLQGTQRERDNARKELEQRSPRQGSALMGYEAPAPTKEQECISLAQRLAKFDPGWESEKTQIEHIRFTMTALGCGCDNTQKK